MDKLLCLLIALHFIKNMAGTLCQAGLVSSPKAPSFSLTFIHQVHVELLLCAMYCSIQWRGRTHPMCELFSTWLTPTHLPEPLCIFSPTEPFLNLPESGASSSPTLRVLAAACLASASPFRAEATSLSSCFQGQAHKRQPLDVCWILSLGNKLQRAGSVLFTTTSPRTVPEHSGCEIHVYRKDG